MLSNSVCVCAFRLIFISMLHIHWLSILGIHLHSCIRDIVSIAHSLIVVSYTLFFPVFYHDFQRTITLVETICCISIFLCCAFRLIRAFGTKFDRKIYHTNTDLPLKCRLLQISLVQSILLTLSAFLIVVVFLSFIYRSIIINRWNRFA